MRVLILGGYGVFGGRLAELLSDIPNLEIIISGRSGVKAAAFCKAFKGVTKASPLALNRSTLADHITALNLDFVIDASGPFQDYGDQRYYVVETCINAGVHYLDFADAADFVFGIAQFDAAAKAADVCVLSGVSSFPVLTAAVLREMAREMDIITVHGGIAPSPYAGIGLNVMRAVAGYAGGPLKLFRDGTVSEAYGLTESMRYTIAVPGKMPLRNLHFSLVDVPDLQVIPPQYPQMAEIWMGAAPVPEFLHKALNIMAKLRARFHLPAMTPLSPLFHWVLNRMKYGEHRGGMFVHATGTKDGKILARSWHLLAEGDDGPYIPSMAIEAILRQHLEGHKQASGARPAIDALTLADYQKLFAKRAIYTGFRDMEQANQSAFDQVLGGALNELPPQVKLLHQDTGPSHWQGTAKITRATTLPGKLIARIIGFPQSGDAIPVTVNIARKNGCEVWTRTFGDTRFSSQMQAGSGHQNHLMLERFGPITIALALVHKDNRLYFIPRSWSLWGIPLPGFLLPGGDSFEHERMGRFHFDITIKAPLIGTLVSYKGWLAPVSDHHKNATAMNP